MKHIKIPPSSWAFQRLIRIKGRFTRIYIELEKLVFLQVVVGWGIVLLTGAVWLLRTLLCTRSGIALVAGVLVLLLFLVQVNKCLALNPLQYPLHALYVSLSSWVL
jgi:hypothetical protein